MNMQYYPYDIGAVSAELASQYMAEMYGDDIGVPRDIGAVAPTRVPPPQRVNGGIVPAGGAPRTRGGSPGPVRRPAPRPRAQSAADRYEVMGGVDFDSVERSLARVSAMEEALRAQQAERNLQESIEMTLRGRLQQVLGARAGLPGLGDRPNVINQGMLTAREIRAQSQWHTGVPFSATIPANATVRISLDPQRWFTGKRLVVPPTIGAAIEIVDIKVANASQLIASGSIAGDSLPPDLTVESNFESSECPPGQTMEIMVVNLTPAPLPVAITYFGIASMTSLQGNY